MKNLFLMALLLTTFMSGCKKDKIKNTVSGRYVSCVAGIETPVANTAIDLFQQRWQ